VLQNGRDEDGWTRVDDNQPEGPIELVLPADARLIRIPRLVASGIASCAGFDLDEVEDLRIAVDEACTALVEGGDGSPILLGFDLRPAEVALVGTTSAIGRPELEPDRLALSRQILSVVVDEYEIRAEMGQLSVRLRKRRVAANVDG
jgi:serine/threonine-protein kinase RsbW